MAACQAEAVELTDGVVTLRTPTDEDAPRLLELIHDSLAELGPFLPWATPAQSLDDTLSWIHDVAEVKFVVLADDEIVGACGLHQFNEVNRIANLGYWIATPATGRGHATRATRLLARHGFEQHALARIEIVMSVENAASRRVAERVGARHEGVLRRRLLIHGRHHDADLFSLVPGEV